MDLLDPQEARRIGERVVEALEWKAPWFMISSATRKGTDTLVQTIARALDEMKKLELEQQKLLEASPGSIN
jgi:putative protein kinase ArgK-like GTPase of G3E family